MPKPFKLFSTRPLPAGAEVVTHDGKPHVRLKDRGRPVLCPLTKDGRGYLRPSKCWYFKYRDASGTVRRMKGFADLKATEQLAAETERKAARVRVGIIDPSEEHARRPLVEHLKDYAAHLEAKGGTAEHIALTAGRVSALLTGGGFVFPADADAARAAEWLNALRRDGSPAALPAGDSFSPAKAAELLGVSGAAIRATINRLKLPATGHGKARRFPRSTVEALVANRARGCAPETVNHYVRAVRGFFRWLIRAKRIGSNPLESLSLVNAAVDVRRARRELTADELRRLFDAARTSARSYRGLTGVDRYFLYLVAAGTGFRAGALANLTPAEFDLERDAPVVTLPARFAKNRRTKVQPLPADIAEALRVYLTDKPTGAPVWGGTWARDHRGAEMIRGDLKAAGIPYAVEGPDGPEYADFHALRHSYLTLGGRSGIDLRTLQELAGHSKPELTARYSHRRLYDLAGAVEKLPNLVPTTAPEVVEVPLRLTGTEAGAGVPPGVPTGYAGRHQSASSGNLRIIAGSPDGLRQPLEMTGAGTSRHRPASIDISEDDGTRTRNHRIDSVIPCPAQALENSQLTTLTPDSHCASSVASCCSV
jgi:excisionase family DNA binding protein